MSVIRYRTSQYLVVEEDGGVNECGRQAEWDGSSLAQQANQRLFFYFIFILNWSSFWLFSVYTWKDSGLVTFKHSTR